MYDKRRSIKSYMLTNNITIKPPIFRGQAIMEHGTIVIFATKCFQNGIIRIPPR